MGTSNNRITRNYIAQMICKELIKTREDFDSIKSCSWDPEITFDANKKIQTAEDYFNQFLGAGEYGLSSISFSTQYNIADEILRVFNPYYANGVITFRYIDEKGEQKISFNSGVYTNALRIYYGKTYNGKIHREITRYIISKVKDVKVPVPEIKQRKAEDFYNLELGNDSYIVENLIPYGVTILGANRKIGKSWLALDLCEAVSTGAELFGLKCKKGRCLYLDYETGEQFLAERLQQRKTIPSANFEVMQFEDLEKMYSPNPLPLIGEGFEDFIQKYFNDNPDTKLIIVDTLNHIKPLPKRGENQYQSEDAQISSLRDFALSKKLAIVLITHTTKGAHEDPFDDIHGSRGITAGSTMNLVMRKDLKTPSIVKLESSGKVKSEDFLITFNTNTLRWECTGRAKGNDEQNRKIAYLRSGVREAIFKVADNTPEGIRGASFSKILGKARDLGFTGDFTGQQFTQFIDEYKNDLKEVGIEISVHKNGSGGKLYDIKLWKKLK